MGVGWKTVKVGAVLGIGTVLAQIIGMTAAQAATPVPETPDSSAGFNGIVRVVAFGTNGVVYVGGDFTAAIQNGQSIARNHVAAIDENTGQVLPWNPNANNIVRAITVDGSSVYIGGSFSQVSGKKHDHIARIDASTGVVDPTFTPAVNSAVKALAVGGGELYAGGKFTTANGQPVANLAAFDLGTGALDTTWQPTTNDMVWALQYANGMVYVGGQFTNLDGTLKGRYVAPVDPTTGAMQANWNSPVTYRVLALAVTPTTIYAAADGNGGHLRALSLTGQSLWTSTADGAYESVTTVNDVIYTGGHFGNVCNDANNGFQGACLDGQSKRGKFAAYDTSGNLLPWSPQGNSAIGTWALASDPSTGRVAAGGEWTTLNSGHIQQPYFALFG
jgi:hypothetical protein